MDLLPHLHEGVRVTLHDARTLSGKLRAFDKHMNIVLAECRETVRLPPQRRADQEEEEKERERRASPARAAGRELGLVVIRGENVVSVTLEKKRAGERRSATGGAGEVAAPAVR